MKKTKQSKKTKASQDRYELWGYTAIGIVRAICILAAIIVLIVAAQR